jgi:DNAJ protein RME-8 N-terminal
LLSRLILACKTGSSDKKSVELACREFNANVPCPGIAPGTEINQVRNALTGVLINLHREVIAALADERTDNSRLIITLLQTLYRIIPCVHGYKCFLEVKEIDTRLLLLQLMKVDRDFVNYWTLEVLSVLCRCPLAPRSVQQEFVNKHTLLTDRMLKCLIDLMSNRLDGVEEAATSTLEAPSSSSSTRQPAQAESRQQRIKRIKKSLASAQEKKQHRHRVLHPTLFQQHIWAVGRWVYQPIRTPLQPLILHAWTQVLCGSNLSPLHLHPWHKRVGLHQVVKAISAERKTGMVWSLLSSLTPWSS